MAGLIKMAVVNGVRYRPEDAPVQHVVEAPASEEQARPSHKSTRKPRKSTK